MRFRVFNQKLWTNQERMFENVKENVPSNTSMNFVDNFLLETQSLKRFFEMKFSLIYQLFLAQSFLEKVITLYQNES